MQLPSLCKFFVHIPETGILCSYTDYQNQVNSYMQKKFFLIFFIFLPERLVIFRYFIVFSYCRSFKK